MPTGSREALAYRTRLIKMSTNPRQLPDHPKGAPPHPPTPVSGESPTAYADRVGTWYVAKQSARHRKQHGLYLTPVAVAEYMAQRIDAQGRRLRVLDPAAGAGAAPCLKAALPAPLVGFENHLNYVHRPSGELGEDETWGLAALYSSRLLDAYFRTAIRR